jgi:hypothetical protein
MENKSELERIISAIKAGKIPTSAARTDAGIQVLSSKRRAAAKMVESSLRKAGFDEDKFKKLVADDQKAVRAAFEKRRAAAAKNARGSNAAFRSAMAARAQALSLVHVPFAPTIVSLDKPFLIWEFPLQAIFIEAHVESMNSSVRVFVETDRETDATNFVFFFLWSNAADSAAVVNVRSSLIAHGFCRVQAKAGLFSGDTATLNIDATLEIMRWSGWGTDPITGRSNDQTLHPDFQPTQRQNIASLRAKGGHIFDDADSDSKSFVFDGFPVSHSLLVIPSGATVVFQVTLGLRFGFDGGNDIQDKILVDFSEHGRAVFCPNVELEVLTPLSNLTPLSGLTTN